MFPIYSSYNLNFKYFQLVSIRHIHYGDLVVVVVCSVDTVIQDFIIHISNIYLTSDRHYQHAIR